MLIRLTSSLAALLLASVALAQPLTTAFTFQGQLASSGAPVSGLYDMRFRLYDALTGGTQQGPTLCSDNVTVTQGMATVQLDFGAVFTGAQRFLEIDVRQDAGLNCSNSAGFTTLGPRQPLTGTPNAVFSLSAATATTATNATSLNNQPASFYTSAGNLSSGTLPSARLGGLYSSALTLSSPANVFAGNGAAITALDAGNVAAGTLADSRLSGNIPRLDSVNAFSGATNSYTGKVGIGLASPGATLDIIGDGSGGQFGSPADALRVHGLNGAAVELGGGLGTTTFNGGGITLSGGNGIDNPSGFGSRGGWVNIGAGNSGASSGSGNNSTPGGSIFMSAGRSATPTGGAAATHHGSVFFRVPAATGPTQAGGVSIGDNFNFSSEQNSAAMLEVLGGNSTFPVLSVAGSVGASASISAGSGQVSPFTAAGNLFLAGGGGGSSSSGGTAGGDVGLFGGGGGSSFGASAGGRGGNIILATGAGGSGGTPGASGGVMVEPSNALRNPAALLHVAGDVRADDQIAWFDPSSGAARAILGWTSDIAHIQIGGSGVGSTNGLDIQNSTSTSLMRLLDGGRVGIGTTTPDSRLHVMDSSAGSVTAIANTIAAFERGGAGYLSILTPAANERGIVFGDPTNAADVGIIANNSSEPHGMELRTGGNAVRLAIDSTGNVGIGTAGNSIDARLHVQSDSARVMKVDRYTTDGELLAWARDDTPIGSVSVTGGVVTYGAFTGVHYAHLEAETQVGDLVSLTGNNSTLGNRKDGEVVYGVVTTAKANDPAALGVYVGSLKAEDLGHPHDIAQVAAVGNGDMWVVDTGSPIEPGDYLISSAVAGCAMKDDPSSYPIGNVIAKAGQRVDWSRVAPDGSGVKRVRVSVFFTMFARADQSVDERLRRLESLLGLR